MCVEFVRAVLLHTNEDCFGKSHTFLVCTHSKVEDCMSFLHKHLLDLAWAPQVCAVPCNMLSHLTTFQKHLCTARNIWLSTFSSNRSIGWRSGECRVKSVAHLECAASNYCNALWFVGSHLYGGALNPSPQWLMFDTPELPKIFLEEHIFNIFCMKTWLWCQQHEVLPFMLFQ